MSYQIPPQLYVRFCYPFQSLYRLSTLFCNRLTHNNTSRYWNYIDNPYRYRKGVDGETNKEKNREKISGLSLVINFICILRVAMVVFLLFIFIN